MNKRAFLYVTLFSKPTAISEASKEPREMWKRRVEKKKSANGGKRGVREVIRENKARKRKLRKMIQ
jgi:hypothetical protein